MPDKSWKRLGSRIISDQKVLRLRQDRYRLLPEEIEDDFVVLEVPDWVNVIALTEGRDVVLIRQYRHGSQKVELEIPGGMVDPGEDAAQAAIRELQEETGYRAEKVTPLGAVNPNPALQNNLCYSFLAENVQFTGIDAQETLERIEVVKRPLDEIPQLIETGVITHSLVVVAFARLGVLAR